MTKQFETVNTGLSGVAVCTSSISSTVADAQGSPHVLYRGKSIYDAVKHPFEDVVHLLIKCDFPDRTQAESFCRTLKENRALDKKIIDHIKTYPKHVNRMDFLLSTLAFARMFDEDYNNPVWRNPKAAPEELAGLIERVGIRMGAKIPTIIAYGHRILNGLDPIPPNDALSHSKNLLHMMGLSENEEDAKALDVTLTLYLDHTISNSTFIARVAESARTDPYGPFIAAGVGLKGVLHGGANEMACHQFDEIESPERVEEYVMGRLSKGEVIFGFGHRLANYKREKESRVCIAENVAREITNRRGNKKLFDTYERLIEFMSSEKVDREKRRAPNLDLPVSIIYRTLGIPVEWNTPIFQSARHFGWVAHMIEQRIDRCPLYRPTQK